jgi:hypothetical protein
VKKSEVMDAEKVDHPLSPDDIDVTITDSDDKISKKSKRTSTKRPV